MTDEGQTTLVTGDWVATPPDGEELLVSAYGGEDGRLVLVDVATGTAGFAAGGATFATFSADGSSLYYFTKDGASERSWFRLAEGHLVDGEVRRDRFIGDVEDYLYSYFGTATRPCL